jgi:hypothetical protein
MSANWNLPLAGLLLGLLFVPAVGRAQGTLDGLRADVRTDEPDDDSPRDDRGRGRRYDDDCDDEPYDSLWQEMAAWIVTSPFWGPQVLLGDSLRADSQFLSYPYKRDWDGNMIIDEGYSPFTKRWIMRLRGEYAHDFDRLARAGGHVLVDTSFRLGFDTSFDYRQENLPGGGEDELWTGDFNLLYRFAQSEFIQMRAGLGVNWLEDSVGDDFGFNFTYGGDAMPLRPFILSAEIDWGRLGHAALFHGRGTIGVEYRHVELYTGYDYFDVGGTQISGWIAGVRLWF